MSAAHLFGHPKLIHLRQGAIRLGLAPGCGGSVAYFAQETSAGIRDWFRPATPGDAHGADGEVMACFPLVPVSGRVAGASFRWDGRRVELSRNVKREPNHLHGEGWRLPWEARSVTASSATLALDEGVGDWPFRYSSRFDYSLGVSDLTIGMSVRNEGAEDMPAAIGAHPWFPPPPAELTADARVLWTIGADKLFTGKSSPAARHDFSGGAPLASTDLEHGFSGWDGHASLRWPGRPGTLLIDASAELGHLVIFTRHPSGAFCVEPVSCSVDAFNLAARGVTATGMRRLAPGEELRATVRFTVSA